MEVKTEEVIKTNSSEVEHTQENMETSDCKNDDSKDQKAEPEKLIDEKPCITEEPSITEVKKEITNGMIKNSRNPIITIKPIQMLTGNKSNLRPDNPRKRKRRSNPRRSKKMPKNQLTSYEVPLAQINESDATEDTVETSTDISKREDKEYCLTVSNLPNSWSFMEIKNYVDTECGPVDEIEMIKDDKTGFGAIRLSYQDEAECNAAAEKLKDKEVSGNKLVLEITVEDVESDSESKSETDDSRTPWMPDLDSWDVDLQGMYGLKLEYLKSLGITPPLDKWVHVSNFRCDKTELRDIMELAGHVQMCSVFTISTRYANVMYSHPLEAVQAVSMLNNQQFYGKPLKVAMDRSPINTILLPRGLTTIGKGLGMNGKPLRNIVKHYERFVANKDCLISPLMFEIPEDHSMRQSENFETVQFTVKSVEEFNYPIVAASVSTATPVQRCPPPKPVQTSALLRPAVIQTKTFNQLRPTPPAANFTPVQRVFGPNFGPSYNQQPMNGNAMQGPQAPLIPQRPATPQFPYAQQFPGPQAGPMGPQVGPMGPQVGPMGPQVGPMGPQVGPMGPGWVPGPGHMRPPGPNEPVKLILSNLPPSTTFGLLCSKMSEWGHVVCIQLTTPGCAVVTFANRMQADACYQHFNGRIIENHRIQMKYA